MVNEDKNLVNELEHGEDNSLVFHVFLDKKVLEPCKRTNLFKTHCKSSGKVCNVIMDSGSTNNLVAKEMV